MGDVLEYLEKSYGLEFESGDAVLDEEIDQTHQFVASVDGYRFETYRGNGVNAVVYENGEVSGVVETDATTVRDIERHLAREITDVSDRILEDWFE